MASRRDLGRALLSCVADHDWSQVPEALDAAVRLGRLSELVGLARYHRALNFLYLSLKPRPPEDLHTMEWLERHYTSQVGRHLRAMADLRELGAALQAESISWLLFKGPVLSEVIYDRTDLRTYEDVDVLVPEAAYARCIDVLESSGFRLLDRNWKLIRRERRGQLHVVLRLGTVADVHWHLLNRGSVRTSFAVGMDPIFERARTVRVGAEDFATLDPVDTLLHLCLHAGLSGGDRLIWLKDIERTLATELPVWDEVVRRARSWRSAAPVGVMLERARVKLGAPVPPEVVPALIGSRSKRGVGAFVDARWPVECNMSRHAPPVLWCHSIRDTWPATMGALALRLLRRPARLARTGLGDAEGGTVPAEVMRSTGDTETRSEYFRSLESGSD